MSAPRAVNAWNKLPTGDLLSRLGDTGTAAAADGIETMTLALGVALASRWGHLPRNVQEEMFETAVSLAQASPDTDFRDQLALFLHARNERTAHRS